MSHSTLATLSGEELRSIGMLYRAFTEKNPALLDEALAPDWQDMPLAPGQGPGPDGLKDLLPGFFTAFPDLEVTIDEIIGHSGKAGVRAKITATHLGEFLGLAATGRAVTVALHEFHHLKEGKTTHTWHLEDWFGMLCQAGVWPPAIG